MYEDFDSLDYFVSSRKVAFSQALLRKFNIEMLILCAAYRSLLTNVLVLILCQEHVSCI
jgi:hypothetical protein